MAYNPLSEFTDGQLAAEIKRRAEFAEPDERVLALAELAGQEALCELVDDLAALSASKVNNGGPARQALFLIENLGVEAAIADLQTLAPN